MGIDRPDFVDGEPVASAEVATVPRDEDGKVFRADWSDGPPPPAPDANFEPPSDPNAEGRAIVAEQNGDEPGSFDEIHPNAQTLFRDQAGLDQVHASIAMVKAKLGHEFAEMDADFDALPRDAKMTVAALISHDWVQHGPEAVRDAIAELSADLPLASTAALNEFVDDWLDTEE